MTAEVLHIQDFRRARQFGGADDVMPGLTILASGGEETLRAQ